MADFKLLGSQDPATNSIGQMTQGLGYPLREVDPSTAGGQVNIITSEVIRAASLITQIPPAINTPIQLTFGDAQITGLGFDLDAAGVFTCTTDDEYSFRVLLQLGRTGNPNNAIIFARLLVNGIQYGNSVFSKIDDSDDQIPATFEGTLSLINGDEVTIEIHNDGAGINAGGVFAATSSLWGTAPSCQMVISRSLAIETA